MAFVEKTGKSVDEAVAAALAELNVTADQAVVEVLELSLIHISEPTRP